MSLVLEGVSKVAEGQHHVYPTDLTLERGTMNVLLGPTLSGKTTLMRIMAGLDVPATGRVLWEGRDVTGMRVQDRKVAMVYQQFINYPSMTVYDNIASPLRLMGVSRAEIDRRVQEAAALMQLTPLLQRKPLELSGGQQQRCALARALVKNAGLVLLDEPLANLDYKLREELRAEIPRIFEESGAIFVYATTEPEEALLLGGNVATMWQGEVTQFGPTPQVYRAPKDVITARVISDPPMNFTRITKAGNKVSFGEGQVAAAKGAMANLPDGSYRAGFRPDHLHLRAQGNDGLHFRCTLKVTEITGSETFMHLDHAGESYVGLMHGVHHLEFGQPIEVWLDAAHVHVFAESGQLVAPASFVQAA
ncbi:ABC transporter ATP-binding protein [Halodurantibacterium flavum]|uniref:ABC transporter ATP-binding protein n=1 Tax=Halodurantibacterium flavum TaxID=1382802 RepID=A0ABW4S0K9_9RHOB